jgi:uncharacterized membrane protein
MMLSPQSTPLRVSGSQVSSRVWDGAGVAVIVAVLAVTLGGFFRFYHIAHKVYWGDEVYTSIRILGVTEGALVQRAPRVHDVHDLWIILHPLPAQGVAGALGPARSLALEEPHHAPLYYEVAHAWTAIFGNAIATTRALSALISLVALPLAFWFAWELFGTRTAGSIAVALVALSPFAIVYAQEAREYALWSVALLALSAALLRALRLEQPRAWTLVAVLVACNFYVSALSLLVMPAFIAYVLTTRWGNRRQLASFGIALAGGAAACIPWILASFRNLPAAVASLDTTLRTPTGKTEVIRAFAGLLRLNLFDADFVRSSPGGMLLTLLALIAIAVAVTYVIRRAPLRVWLFIALPIMTTAGVLVVSDFFGGQRVHNPRYFMPVFLYLDFFFVGFFSSSAWTVRRSRTALAYALLVVVLLARGVSAAESAQAPTWWNKMHDNSISVASAVNRTEHPVIVSDAYLVYALALSNYLRPGVRVALRPSCYMCSDRTPPRVDATLLPRGHYSDLFALGPSPRLQRLLRTLIAEREPAVAYHCINVRDNCVSALNIEPVFGAAARDQGLR